MSLQEQIHATGLSILLVLLLSCGPEQAANSRKELVIFAASSLTNGFTEVAHAFEIEHPKVEIVLNFAASSLLRTQLSHGAKADLFASADARQMDLARSSGLLKGDPIIFATNQVIIIARRNGPVQHFRDLARPGVRLVMTLPEVPVGVYTDHMLELLDSAPGWGPAFVQAVRANVVSLEQNVRTAVSKVVLGEVDASFSYLTDARGLPEENLILPPDGVGVQARYFIATTRDDDTTGASGDFVQFLLSPEGQTLLSQWGFERIPK